jgi:hypothetical protein
MPSLLEVAEGKSQSNGQLWEQLLGQEPPRVARRSTPRSGTRRLTLALTSSDIDITAPTMCAPTSCGASATPAIEGDWILLHCSNVRSIIKPRDRT